MAADIAQCPECGWTGQESDFGVNKDEQKCPVYQYTMKRV